jgi:hypothetical protein
LLYTLIDSHLQGDFEMCMKSLVKKDSGFWS